MTRLRDVPLDVLQEASAALDRYVRARRKQKLLQERARLQEELQDMRTDLAEIEALSTGVDRKVEGENHA
jgi:Skp family chaperone for outer membrane proteins